MYNIIKKKMLMIVSAAGGSEVSSCGNIYLHMYINFTNILYHKVSKIIDLYKVLSKVMSNNNLYTLPKVFITRDIDKLKPNPRL